MQCPRCGAQLATRASFCGECGVNLATVDPNVDRVIAGRYVLRERIGNGALGVVYRAEQVAVGRKLAIKLLLPHAYQDAQLVERFRREGEVMCRLRSPHTVTAYEFDRDVDGSMYIAMELWSGRSLREVFRVEGPFDWVRTLRIASDLCDALGEAHEHGIIHRDLRPDTILLESRPGHPDFVKVLDFGFAKSTAQATLSFPGEVHTDLEFSSPEQLLSKPVDGRSDMYALGVLAYLMLTGKHPFPDAKSVGNLVAAHVERVPPRPSTLCYDLPADIDDLVARCLEKDPARRFPDMGALRAIIRVALRGVGPVDSTETIRDDSALGDEDTVLAPKR